MRRSVFHGMLFHLNTAPVCVCVCIAALCFSFTIIHVMHEGMTPGLRHTVNMYAPGWAGHWGVYTPDILATCTSVTDAHHSILSPSHISCFCPPCVSLLLYWNRQAAITAVVKKKKSKSCQRPNKVNNADEPYAMCVSAWKPSRQVLKLSIIL